MHFGSSGWGLVLLITAAASGCVDQRQAEGDRAHAQFAAADTGGPAVERQVKDLPFAQGRSFATLDDYLAFRRERGAVDVPWYRETAPGVYELVSRRGPGAEPKTYTRAQLMEKFGFAR